MLLYKCFPNGLFWKHADIICLVCQNWILDLVYPNTANIDPKPFSSQNACSVINKRLSDFFSRYHCTIKRSDPCFTNEPVHEISNNVVCATSKASDQPAHTLSLIRAFASKYINKIYKCEE